MKALILLLFTTITFAQYHTDKKTTLGLLSEPYTSFDKKGVNIALELFFSENHFYIHTGIQSFSVIEGGYLHWTNGVGYFKPIGKFDPLVTVYSGVRLGFIRRGQRTYPTTGLESGIRFNINDNLVLGARITYEYSSDYEFWDNTNKINKNGFLEIAYKL